MNMADNEMPLWGRILIGVLGLLAGAGAGYAIYEHNRANKEQKKRQDIEFGWQSSEAEWQEQERTYLNDLQNESKKREKDQQIIDSLLKMMEEQNLCTSPDEINSMQKVFNVFANDGANIYSKDSKNDYLLSDSTIQRAIDICTALQNAPNLQSDLQANGLLLFKINMLKSQLSIRLADNASRKMAAEAWQKIVNSFQKKRPILVTPIRENKGGFICSIEGIYNAFLPNSHSGDHCTINQPIQVLIINADDNSRKVIVSARELERKMEFETFISNNPIGSMISGKIDKILGEEGHAALVLITDNGLCGYLPKANVLGHPFRLDDNIFSINQEICVYIKKIDSVKRHILLSMFKPSLRNSKASKNYDIKKKNRKALCMDRFREYNKDRDTCYHFLNTPNLYITPEIVDDIFAFIGHPTTQEDRDVMTFIKETESMKMQYCMGKISLNEKRAQCIKLDDEFCAKHSCWPYSCDYYKRFYSALGCDE